MALKKCKECGQEVSTAAKACPKCGTPSPTGSSLFRKAVVGLSILFVLGLFGARSERGGTKTASVASSAAATKVDAPALEVASGELWKAYQANEVAADNLYKGKRLRVKGSVASIDKNAFGGVFVSLATPNEFMNIHANLERSEIAKAAALQKGQRISVSCVGGTMIVGSPMLDDCTIE